MKNTAQESVISQTIPFKLDMNTMSHFTIDDIVSKMSTYDELNGFLKDFT